MLMRVDTTSALSKAWLAPGGVHKYCFWSIQWAVYKIIELQKKHGSIPVINESEMQSQKEKGLWKINQKIQKGTVAKAGLSKSIPSRIKKKHTSSVCTHQFIYNFILQI
jgi:hypothetical protein